MKFNPNFLAIVGFLIVGLIWSGGHVGWLIALGVYIFLACWVIPTLDEFANPKKRNGR